MKYVMIESFSEISLNELGKLNQLDEIFESCKFNFQLKEGDLVLFRNDLILHGRESFEQDSERLIKRVRFNTFN